MKETFLYQINVTRDCNLRCQHCYIHSDKKAASKLMTPEQWLSVVRQVRDHISSSDYKHAEIHCIGGEPTMLGIEFFEAVLPETRKILAEVSQKVTLKLVTNLLTDDALRIAQMFDSVATSYEPETRFPKEKLYHRWLQNVHSLRDTDGIDIGATTAITKPVIRYGAARLLDFYLNELGIKQVHLGFYIPSGDGLVNDYLVNPTHDMTSDYLISAAKWYFNKRDEHRDLFVNPMESLLAAIDAETAFDDIICPIISGSIDIDWDGNAVSCIELGGALDVDYFGNVFENPIQELVKTDGYLKEVRNASRPKPVCMSCDEHHICQAGCGVLHSYWNEEDECPGFKRFIKYMRTLYDKGFRPKIANYGMSK